MPLCVGADLLTSKVLTCTGLCDSSMTLMMPGSQSGAPVCSATGLCWEQGDHNAIGGYKV